MLNLLVAAAAMTFPGGTTNDLVKSLADSFKLNVVAIESSNQTIAAFDYEPGNLNLLAQNLRWKTTMQLTPGADLIANDGMLPESVVAPVAETRRPKLAASMVIPADGIKGGKVHLVTTGSDLVPMRSLSSANFSKPVKIPWVYTDYAFAANVNDMAEQDFITFVAKGAGGRLLTTDKAYEIQIDPTEVRRRAIKTIEAEKPSDEPTQKAVEVAKNNLRVAAIQAMTVKQLTDYLANSGGSVRIALAGGLINPATAYVKAMEAEQKVALQDQQANQNTENVGRQRGRRGRQNANIIGVLQRVNPRQTSYVVIQPLFQVGLEIATIGQGGIVKM